ncbi:hypothetical protein Bca101_048471 [Brassica carinata]
MMFLCSFKVTNNGCKNMKKELRKALAEINEWSMSGVSARLNRCAAKVAKSVTLEMRYQSYVARGAPGWLCDVLEDDKQGR